MRHYACAILVRNGTLLLGRRSPHRRAYAGKWDVLGGLVEPGETREQALARELMEEVGVTPLRWDPLPAVLDRGPEARGEATYHMAAVHGWQGEPAILDQEHTELRWFTVEQACALPDLALQDYRAVFRAITQPLTPPVSGL